MPEPQALKLATILLDIGGTNFEHQLIDFKINPTSDDGDVTYTFGGNPDDPTKPGAIVEDVDPDESIDLTFLSDWATGGICDYLWVHNGETVSFQIDHHTNEVGQHTRFSGQLKLKAPPVGGAANDTEKTEITLKVVGSVNYVHL